MSTPKLVALGLSLALVGGAVVLLGPSTSTPSHTSRATADPAHTPAAAFAPRASRMGQGQELAELRHQVRVLTEAADRAEAVSVEAHSASELTPSDALGDDPVVDTIELTEVLDVHLSDEAHDAAATDRASSHIADRLAESEAGELLSTDCGETLCRSTLGFGDLAQRDAGLGDIGSLMPWDADGFFSTDPDDELRVSVYFTRDGQALPMTGEAS